MTFQYVRFFVTYSAKRVYFVEEVTRAKNPILFWIIVILWLLLGIYSLLESFFPYLSS